ncbi:MAG: hypothetical protein JEZ10_08285, partial [Verrucomicrobia bacterium]|nr:hypothetical protein [Verrucomicrobiota bacterium]
INKQVVIDEGWNEWAGEVTGWRSSDKDDLKYGMGHSGVTIGDWFELEAEVPVVMEVLLEEDGGTGAFMLVIEQEGEYYPENREGAPVLPVFKTAEIPASVRAEIEYTLIRGEVELEVGPTFNVY